MGMTLDDIYQKLRTYRANIGRCAHLRADIKYIESMSHAESDAIAEEVAYHSRELSLAPGGGGIGDPTASAAAELIEKRKEIARSMGYELIEMQKELYEKIRACNYVDGWLNGLLPRERFIIECHVIDGNDWLKTLDMYEAEYGRQDYGLDGIKKAQRRIVKKIRDEMANS